MMPNQKGVLLMVAVLCAMLPLPQVAFSDEASPFWTLRGVAGLSAEARIELAKASIPIWRGVESSETLREIVNDVCGDQPKEVRDFLLTEALKLNLLVNPDEAITAEAAAIAIPFCLKIEKNVPVTIQPGDTPESLLRDNYGVFGPRTLDRLFRLNQEHFGAGSLREFATNLPIGEVVTLPYASEKRVFAAADATAANFPDFLEQEWFSASLLEIQGSVSAVATSPDREPFQFKSVDSVDFQSSTRACAQGGTIATITDLDLLKARFAEEEAAKQASDGAPAEPVTVGLIDSGVATVGDDFFKPSFFAANPGELDKRLGEDDDGNDFLDDIYGINFNTRSGEIRPYATSGSIKPHGTKMATLILGGPTIASTWTASRPVPVVRLSVVNFASSVIPGANVDASNLSSAINYLVKRQSRVINLSLSNAKNIVSVSQAIQLAPDVLFVVAAGNAKVGPGQDLDLQPLVFPARYGGRIGKHSTNVLTVGATDADGKWAKFSNFSAQYVDLLAPGCGVETRDDSGSSVIDAGTSPATAIVTFASALIASLGVSDPQSIKNRLLLSTDVDSGLADRAWSSGVINIVKAISIRNDVIRLSSHDYIFGHLEDAESLGRYCADADLRPHLRRIKKIVPNIVREGQVNISYWLENDGTIQRKECRQIQISPSDSIGIVNGLPGPGIDLVQDITFSTF